MKAAVDLARLARASHSAAVSDICDQGGYRRATDSLGRVSIRSVDEPVEIGGVIVRNGDLVVADADGVVIVPASIATEVAEAAMARAEVETDARRLLQDGALLADVWERYKVL